MGASGRYAEECYAGGFIGVDYGFQQDLSQHLPADWQSFNREFIPVFLADNPGKTKISAGLACGMTWTVAKGLQNDDIVLSPNGKGGYLVGVVTGGYQHQADGILPHRRPVRWLTTLIDRNQMSPELRSSCGSFGTVCEITRYASEIERLTSGLVQPFPVSGDEVIEDPYAFAMEKHLEDFIVKNWVHTSFGKDFQVYEDNDGRIGQQYPTNTGPIDILAVSKDKKVLLVIELKRGRPSDVVVGQILRYMGYIKSDLAEEGQEVKGVIIALEEDPRLRQALKMVEFIDFYLYQVHFKLVKV